MQAQSDWVEVVYTLKQVRERIGAMMMNIRNDGSLEPLISPELAVLKAQLKAVACMMDFEVYSVPPGKAISEELHRQALGVFFESKREENMQHRLAVIREYPQYAGSKLFAPLEVNCAQAMATQLPPDRVLQLLVREGPMDGPCLFGSFSGPPYGTTGSQGDMERLFERWCDLLGLRPQDGIDVLDWVGDPVKEPLRSQWSNYFDAGHEWESGA